MSFYPDIYEGGIWRPPSEARSLILQATVGCSHNRCTFCISYLEKEFRIKTLEEIKGDIIKVKPYYPDPKRIFLADGNALVIPTDDLVRILELLYSEFSTLERVGIYGGPQDILHKSPEEFTKLKEAGLGIIYLGVESGLNELLLHVRKGANARQMLDAGRRVVDSGIPLSAIIILGLGGKAQSHEHAKETGKLLSEMEPAYIGALTLMLVKGTDTYEEVQRGELEPLDPMGVVAELKVLVENLDVKDCVFRANHASNYVIARGTLPGDKERILIELDEVLSKKDYHFKPEYMRGL